MKAGRLDPNLALLSYFRDPDWTFKTGVGGTINAVCLVLGLASPFCSPIVCALMAFTTGYTLRVARARSLSADTNLPAWDNWLELFMSGLTWLAIQVGLFLIAGSAFTICLLAGAATGAIKVYSAKFLAWVLVSFAVSSTAVFLVSLASLFLMINFATQERISSGFNFAELFGRLKERPADFILTWLLSIGLKWLAVVLPIMTVLGAFLVPSTWFIAELLTVSMAARVWGGDSAQQKS